MAERGGNMMDFVQATVEELRRRQRLPVNERRQHERYELMQQTELVLLHATSIGRHVGDRFSCCVRNISRSGIGVLSTEPLYRGDVFGARLTFGDQTRAVWATVLRAESHSTFVSTKMLRLNDVGAAFCPNYQDFFREGLKSPDRDLRVRHARLLVESNDASAAALLLSGLDAADDEITCESLYFLRQCPGTEPVRPLLKALGSEEVLDIPPAHPLHAELGRAGLLRTRSQLPQAGQDRLLVEVGGRKFVVLIAQDGAEYVASCAEIPRLRVTGPSAEDVLGRIKARLVDEQSQTPASHTGAGGRRVLVADLAAFALRGLTGLELPFDAAAPVAVRLQQRQAWIQEAMKWASLEERSRQDAAGA